MAIEGPIDLCSHVISSNGFHTPEDYADTLRVRDGTNTLFDPEVAQLFSEAVPHD